MIYYKHKENNRPQGVDLDIWLKNHHSISRQSSGVVFLCFKILSDKRKLRLCSVEHNKKNWVMIDTIAGAKSSAIIYSIAETAKANNLKPYDYFEYLLTEIPKHLDDTDRRFLEDLLPWSPNLPMNCRKPDKKEVK